MKQTDNKYCVYVHKDYNGNIMYVGSGTESRANLTCAKSNRGIEYENYVKTKGKLVVDIVSKNLTKEEAIKLEIQLYEKYNDVGLLNSRKPNRVVDLPTKEELERILKYDENSKSGLRWNISKGAVKKNSVAGTLHCKGYWQISIDKKLYLAHRIVAILNGWILTPEQIVDHIDNDRSNNRINNLRIATQAENMRNKVRNQKRLFPVGVSFRKGYFIAHVKDPSNKVASGVNKTLYKCFSVKTYGYDEALVLAVKARQQMLSELEQRLSVKYTSSHK